MTLRSWPFIAVLLVSIAVLGGCESMGKATDAGAELPTIPNYSKDFRMKFADEIGHLCATRDNKMVAVGHEAYDMLGRTPESIEVARPMRDGVIADFVVTEAMLRYFIQSIVGNVNPLLAPLFKPKVMISTPRGVTSVEERAVHDAAMQAGAGGLLEMSRQTRFSPGTSFRIRLLTRFSTSTGNSSQSAVIASWELTTRSTQAFS